MQGSLSEFRLAEILQLVAVQQKTGLLRLSQNTKTVTFYFELGVLIATRDRRHLAYDPLLDYLLRVGWIHPETGGFLRTRVEESRQDIADIIVADRYMTEEDLHAALEDLAQELVHTTFGWREGTYQFVSGEETLAGLHNRIQLKIDSILMEGARRADEWPRLLEKLPGPDVVLDLSGGATSAMGSRAHAVLNLVQGAMRLGDLVRVAKVPEYETYEIVAQAVDAGLVRILEKPEPIRVVTEFGAVRPAFVRRSAIRDLWSLPRPVSWMLTVGVCVGSLVAAWCLAPAVTSATAARAAVELEMESAREAVRQSIEVYRALHGRYPATLTALAQDDLASPELLRRAGPLRYVAQAGGTGFELSTAVSIVPPAR